jgi:hypothetical protein
MPIRHVKQIVYDTFEVDGVEVTVDAALNLNPEQLYQLAKEQTRDEE